MFGRSDAGYDEGTNAREEHVSGPIPSKSPGKFANLVQQSYVEQPSAQKSISNKSTERPKRPSVSQPLRRGLYDSLPSPEQSKHDKTDIT